MKTHTLTIERLRAVLHYDAETGAFMRSGRRVGTRHPAGYIVIKIDGVQHSAHRLAWMYAKGANPSHDVDHRDLDKANNRLSNLRACDDRLNQANTKSRPTNTSGFKGVCWNKSSAKWQAGIKNGDKSEHLGLFDCPVAAHLAYAIAADRIYGEYARIA